VAFTEGKANANNHLEEKTGPEPEGSRDEILSRMIIRRSRTETNRGQSME
jgi:hypothetical protein